MFNFIKKAFNLFGTAVSTSVFGGTLPGATTKDYLTSYQVSHLVRSALKKIAEKSSTIDFELFKVGMGKLDEIEQHDALSLLAKPNNQMSGADLLKITIIFQVLLGNAYWYKVKNESGKPFELYPVRADLMKPKIDKETGEVLVYKYNKGDGTSINFPVDEIIHFKNPNPVNIFEGESDIACLMDIIRASMFSEKWNANFFYNSARPDGILTTDGKVGKQDKDELSEKWQQKYGGYANAHKVAVLGGGLKFQDITRKHTEMGFDKLRTSNRDDLFMTLGVNKAVMGITDDVNRANAETGVYVFMSETIEPIFRAWVEKLNLSLIPDFGDDLYLWFKDPTPEDEKALDEHHDVALNKWLTVNEIRDERGLTTVEGGDVLYQNSGVVPLGQGGMQEGTEKLFVKLVTRKQKRLKNLYKKALRINRFARFKDDIFRDVTEVVKKAETKAEYTEVEKELLWKQFDVRLQKYEDRWKVMQEILFEKQTSRIVKQLKEKDFNGKIKSGDIDIVDWEKENKIFEKKAKPVILEIVNESGEIAMSQVGKYYFDVADKVTAEWIEKKAITFAVEVNNTTKERLRKSLTEGLLEGEGITGLAKRVRQVMRGRIVSSAETIARTETLMSANAGTQFGYEQSGVVEKKEWLAVRDGKTRDTHASVDGKVVKLDGYFIVGGSKLKFPGDPNGSLNEIINCRCTTLAVIKKS